MVDVISDTVREIHFMTDDERAKIISNWLRELADQVDRRGLERIDKGCDVEFNLIDTTKPGDKVCSSLAGRHVKLRMGWTFAK